MNMIRNKNGNTGLIQSTEPSGSRSPHSNQIIGHNLDHEEAARVEEALRGGAADALHQADQVLQ